MSKRAKIILTALVITAVCAAAILLLVRHTGQQEETAPAVSAATEGVTQAPEKVHSTAAAAVLDHDHDEKAPTLQAGVTLPTQGGTLSYFSGSYVPDSRAEDTATGRAVHMRELFGSGYATARMTFQTDGTFTDSLPPTGARAGVYQVENGVLTAAYRPDETMQIDVTAWSSDGTKPVTFCVTYQTVGDKGYRVFYSEKE